MKGSKDAEIIRPSYFLKSLESEIKAKLWRVLNVNLKSLAVLC